MQRNVSGLDLAVYTTEFAKNTYDYVDWHWHTEFQFCIVLGGTVCFRVDDKPYCIPESGGIFINSQHIHMSKPQDCDAASYFCVVFHPDMICADRGSGLYRALVFPALSNPALSAVPLSSGNALQGEILETLLRIRAQYSEKKFGFELDMAAGIFQIWKTMVSLLPLCPGQGHGVEDERLKRIMLLIKEKYSEPLTLDAIARQINISRGECCRYFRKMTGQPLFEYITRFRIDKSVELLLYTDMRISDIAAESGFGTQSYYTECFRKLKGVTPRQFRLSNLSGKTPF